MKLGVLGIPCIFAVAAWGCGAQQHSIPRRDASLESLERALDSRNVDERLSCVRALAARPEPGAVGLLAEALRDGNAQVRMAAVLAAWRRGDVRIVPSLAERLKDSDPAVRCAAAYALRRLDAHRAAEPLAALLHDDNPGVRLHAAKALAESGDARGFEAMKTMAGVPQLMVLYSLKSLEAPEATEIIIEMVGSGSINVHDEAHKQLYGRLDDRTLPLYLAALRHPNEQIRSRVIWVLGGTGCRKAVNALVKSMNEDQDELIRGYAARALGQIGDPSATPALIEALQHPYWAVRQASAESLEKITGQHFGQDADKWKAWYREKQHDRPSK